jgi:hypothetical protein
LLVDKPIYQVSSIDLSDADERTLKVFLRFVGSTEGACWEWSTRDTCDLLLAGAGARLPKGIAESGKPVVAWIADVGDDGAPSTSPILCKPLQMDDFSAVLRIVERRLQGSVIEARDTGPEYSAPARVESRPVSRVVSPQVTPPVREAIPEPIPTLIPKLSPRPIPKPAAEPVRAPAAAPAIQPLAEIPRPPRTGRYRLLRWPKADFLRGRARATRFLSFLASGPLTVDQLCTLSGADRPTCSALLDALDAAGYLETRPAQAAVPVPASIRATAATHAAPVARAPAPSPMPSGMPPMGRKPHIPVPDAGLFGRLRRHFGLG